jgi:hypothetical protein
MEYTIADYEDMARGPGKFEGEPRYVPYFWEMDSSAYEMEGDEFEGYTFTYEVTADDIALFPELKDRKSVSLIEREDGFVIEL